MWLCDVLLALAHKRHATLGWGGVGWLETFKYTSTHTSCYATARPSCTCTNTSCYGTARSSCTCTHTHVMLRYWTFFLHLHTHTRRATLLHVLMLRYCAFFLHLHTHVMLRYCTFFLHLHTHTHTSCQMGWQQVLDRSWMWLKKSCRIA